MESGSGRTLTVSKVPLHWQLGLLLGAVVLIVTLLTTTILGNAMARQSQRMLEAGVESQLQAHAERVRGILAEIERDLRLLHSLPAMQALAQAQSQSRSGGGLRDQSLPEDAMESISEIFRGLLLSRPHYLQLRLLNANSSGTELIRFERAHFDWPIRQATELQHKAHRPYFQAAVQHPPSQVWMGSPSLNREFAQLQQPEQPVLRAGIAVGSADDAEVVALLLINVDADYVLRGGEHAPPPGYLLSVVDQRGEYLLRADNGPRYAFDYGNSAAATQLIPRLRARLGSQEHAKSPLLLRQNGLLTGMLTLLYGPGDERQTLGLIMQSPIQASSIALQSILQRSASSLLGMLILTSILSWVLARSITRPIAALAQTLNRLELSHPELPPAGSSAPEINQLYRSLNQLLQRLREKQQQLLLSHSELQQFAVFVSQEIQRPTRAIHRQLATIADNVQNRLTPDSKEALGKIESITQRQTRLLAAMLKHMRLGADSVIEVVDLNTVSRGVLDDLADQLHQAGAAVQILNTLPTLHGYRDQLELLFFHLLSNSLQYHIPPSKPIIEVSCTAIGPHEWKLIYCDNGPGIEPADMDKVFAVFQRGRNAATSPGAGVGLASCRKVVAMHHGQMYLAKNDHTGACFHMTLKDLKH